MEHVRGQCVGRRGGKQGIALWLIVLERMAAVLQDRYGIEAPEVGQIILEQYALLRDRLVEDLPIHPRHGRYHPPPFPGGPFAASRVQARKLAADQGLPLRDGYQLNSQLVEFRFFPATTLEEAEQLVNLLVDRLVVLALYLARELSPDGSLTLSRVNRSEALTPKVRRFVEQLFWEGLVEPLLPHVQEVSEELDLLEHLCSNPVPWRYTPEQRLKIQLQIAERRVGRTEPILTLLERSPHAEERVWN